MPVSTNVHPSTHQSVMRPVHPSSPMILSVCKLTSMSVALSVHDVASPSVIPIHPSYHHPIYTSLTCQSVTPPVSPAICPSDSPSQSDHLYTILPHLSTCPSSSDHSFTIYTSLSDHPPHLYDEPTSLSACPSPSDCLTATTTRLTIHPSPTTIQHTQDSSQSLAVVNGSNPARPRNSVGPLLSTTYFYMP